MLVTTFPAAVLGCPASSRRALFAAWIGWLLDAFDVMLYALVLGTLIDEFALSKAIAGLLGSLTLIASGFGGILFGVIADRYGRRPALVGSLLVYSVFTFACGLSTTVWQFGSFRFLLGLGMGGDGRAEWRSCPKRGPDAHRAKAMGMMQCAWSVGYAAAALVVALVLPRFGWRAVFFIGIVPAFVALWMRRGIEESPEWLRSRSRHHDWVTPVRAIFSPDSAIDAPVDGAQHGDDLRLLGVEPLGSGVSVVAAVSRRRRFHRHRRDRVGGGDSVRGVPGLCLVRAGWPMRSEGGAASSSTF